MAMTPKEIRKRLVEHDKYLDGEITEKDRNELKERAQRFAIDMNNLADEISRQPAEYAYYAATLATHQTIYARLDLKLKLVEAKVRMEIKGGDSRDGRSGGITVAMMDAMVRNDINYQKAVTDLKNAEYRVQLLTADVTASAQKAAMLKILSPLVQREQSMKGFTADGD